MAKTISQQVLDDFMATLATNPNADRKQLMQAFPEFGNDEKLLDAAYDYRETRLQNPMADMQTINSKFPEFFGGAVEQPAQPAVQPQQQSFAQITGGGNAFMPLAGIANRESERQIAEKEAQMQREEQAQLPISDHDRQLQEQIRQKEIEGKWGKSNGTTFGVDSQTGMPTITKTEGNGAHLYAGEQLANQDEIDALKGQLPSYLTREVKTPQDLLVNTAEAWSSNTEMGRDFKDMLEAGTITPEEYKQTMIEANQDYINQQTRILGQKATNATIADISKTINPIIEQMQAERQKAIERAAGQVQMRGGAYGAIGAQMSANTAYDIKKDAVLSEYLQAQQYLVDAIKISEAAQKGQGFWKGLGGSLGDTDTWDMGISQLVRSANLKKIVEKYEKKPDSLTDSEKALMDAAVAYMSACAYNSDKLSRLYKAGQTTGESLPFMLQFAVMPIGAIKDKVAKGILGYGIEQFGGKALQTAGKYTFGRAAAETGTALLGNVAAAGVQTAAFGAPKIAEGTISRMTGDIKPEFDENGRIVYGGRENQQGLGEALWNAGVDIYVENLSEMILTSGDPIKAWVGGTNLFKNLSKNETIQVLAKMGDKWSGSKMGKIAGQMQFRNYPEEVAEEYVGNLLRWGMSTDVHSAAEAGLDADSQIDLWMGLAPTSIAFAGLGLGEYSVRGGIDRFQSSQAARKLRNIMLEGEERKYLDNLLKSRDSDEFKFAAHDVVKSILRNNELSVQEKRAYLDNLYVTYQSQLALEAEDAKIADEVKTEVQGITNKNNGYVYPVSLAGDPDTQGHIVAGYVEVDETDPSKPRIGNDEIVTVKLNDGRVVQLNTKELDLTGTPQMAQEVFNARAEERINTQRVIDQSKNIFHQGDVATIQVPNEQTGETDEFASNIVSVSDEGVEVEVIDPAGQVSTTVIPHDVALQTLAVVKPNSRQETLEEETPLAEQQTTGAQQTQPQGQTAANMPTFVNGDESISVVDNRDGTYTNPATGEIVTREQMADKGYAFINPQPTSVSQAPVEAPVVQQAPVETPAVQQAPEVQEPAAPVVPNIETMSAADYAGAAVEYMGSREYVDEYLDGEIKKVQQQLDVANRKKVGNVTDMADFKTKKDAIEAEKKALQARLDKLTEAREKAKSYLTIAEREQRAQAEAERRAAEEAARIAREQAAAAEAARLEQERIDRELKKGVPDFSEDNDRDARARGFHVVNGQVIHRQEPLQPLATGKAVTVQFAKGQNGAAEAHHVLIPVSMAQPSHINGQRNPAFFISEAQPKDRRDQVSKVTSDMMAQNIHPDEIVEGATAYVGAPVLNGRGEAVQGNNRLDALIKMYQSHPESVAKYKQYLIDNAEALGYTETDIETIRNNDVIDVRMLDNVTDEQAIQLGQKKATDLETGGVQLIDPQVTANQLNREEGRLQRFAEILLNTNDEEATLADLTLRNGKQALDYLQKLGIINDAQAQSAFDSRGNITAEAKAALQGVLRQVVYTDSKNDNLSYIFDSLPVTAQKAILQTVIRDLDKKTPREAKLVPHIQEAIAALYDALGDEAVRNAKIEADVRSAMQSWATQIKISADSDAENLPGSEKFSNFARELATLFKYGKQTEIAKKLNAYYDAVQGTVDMFGETPAIPFKEAVELIFGIDYKSVDQVRREKHRKELADYLSTVADTAHPFELFGDDNFIDLLIKLGTSPQKIDFVRNQLAQGKTFEGFAIRGKLYLNADGLATTDKARSKYNHERQHTLTTKEQIERVMRAASRDDLDALVEALSESEGAYSNEAHDVLADEFISFAMEVAYNVNTDEELEAALQAIGANDELINIIKEINNEQRANDQRLGQSERLSNSRRHASVDADSEGRSPQGGRDSGQEPATVEQTGLRTPGSSTVGTGNGGTRESGTEGAGLSEVGSEGVSGEEAGGAGDNAGIAGENQGSSGVGQERGLGEVTATQTEDNAHLSDNESAFVAPQMPIDTQTNAQKQSKAPSDDPRFAISGTQVIPVGEKTLVGLHNISAEKLRKAIKMGGLANPSTAVINIASQNHEQYGDISLIMPSSLVDSKTGRNAGTFTGDIWSPTYPSVERVMDDAGSDKYYDAITKAFGDNEARRPILSRAKLDFDDYLDSGNVRAGLAYWYLLEKGIEPGDVYFQSGISEDIKKRFEPLMENGLMNMTAEERSTLLSLIAEREGKTADDLLQEAQTAKKRYEDTIADPDAKPFYKTIAQRTIEEIDTYGVRYKVLSDGYYAIERAVRDDGKIDLTSTLIAAQDIVQTQYQADFDKWLSDMDKRFDIKEVLFEDYDRDGNRIYKPNTLANASRMMNKEDLQNAGDHSGLGATRGQLVERMETLADIRAEKGRLRPGAEEDFETEEWNKMQDEWFNKVLNPLSEMQKISDNPFSNVGYAETRLQEALRTKDPVATLNKEYGYKIDPNGEWAKNLKDLVQRIKSLPTKYFETKFRRPVYLNEFANAVVPNDLPQDLRAGLESAGLRLFSYDPNTQGSRRDATLEATADEGIRFSISSAKGSPSVARRGNLQYSEGVLPSVAKEMESIKNNALNNGTFMQAPNGKPTNLDERQWLQVRLRSFKRWFGDWQNDPQNASKILDENGEPMVVYHGTWNNFTTFDKKKIYSTNFGKGFYFISDMQKALSYGHYLMPVFLNVRKPLDLTTGDNDAEYNKWYGKKKNPYDGYTFIPTTHGANYTMVVVPNPNQIKSATDNDGSFSEENDDIRFSISNQNNDIFYSNAERAVEGIKQEKATPEQWRAMIEKAGGLKAGEDKWIGLSDWLAQQRPTVTPQANETRSQFVERAAAENKRFTLSKQDLLDYIREHKIQIEETEYGDAMEQDAFRGLAEEYREVWSELRRKGGLTPDELDEAAMQEMNERHGGDDFSFAFNGYRGVLEVANDDAAAYFLEGIGGARPINETRLRYTTFGLENKREIALIVPDIEEWNENDEVHFGDAGEGRAIAWVRFGDAHKIKYGENGEELADVLVIDEIQSKRHQEGRENGYYTGPSSKKLMRQMWQADKAHTDYLESMRDKYGQMRLSELLTHLTDEEVAEADRLNEVANKARQEWYSTPKDAVPVAPFEKNWHELAMKRILRFAAENGYDKVAWTTGEQQAKRYDIGKEIDHIVKTDDYSYDVYPTSGLMMTLDFDEDGIYRDDADREYNGKSMSDIFGKDLAKRLKEMPVDETLQGDGLRVGYDGMKGFYDDILPRFMQKYGKKWGVQVGEVTMPQLEDGYQTMHAIDINDAMRESVLEGQPMFSISGRGVNGTMKPQEGETRSQYIARVAETVKNMTPRNTTIDDAIRFSITVNHNSPYLLKRADGAFVDPETGERLGFDLRFIGKGEGGQAHGYGSYFSANDIREYAERGGITNDVYYKGKYFDYLSDWDEEKFPVDATRVMAWFTTSGFTNGIDVSTKQGMHDALDNAIRYYRRRLEDPQDRAMNGNAFEKTIDVIGELHALVDKFGDDIKVVPAERHHYVADIPDNNGSNYIIEGSKLSGGILEKVSAAIADLQRAKAQYIPEYNPTDEELKEYGDMVASQLNGRTAYDYFVRELGSSKAASEKLNEYGIVGIRYDGRRDGECYVIFNPDDAVITDHIRFSVTSGKSVLPKTTDASQVEHPMRSTYNTNGDIVGDDQIRFSVTNPSTLSRSEIVTKALVQQANNNYNIMQSALKKVTADLKGIRAAMRMQSDYDRKVVDSLLNLYNTLLQENGVWAQYMPDTTRRIATQIVHAIGKQNITEEVNTIMDHMVHAQAKAAQRQWDKLRQTPIDKINISGVVMQGKVALEGQHALKAMNDALQANMTIEQIEEQINQLMDMEDNATDESLKTQYKGQWIGLTIAAQHLERLQHLQEERQQLDLELQSARSNKALKPAARQQLVDNIKQAMRDNYIEQAEAYTRSTQDLSEYVNTQEGRAKDFIRRQDANRDKIRSYAQRDLEGLATNPNRNRTRGNVARSIWDAFASPIRDLQSLLRLTGLHAPDGEGYLYNHFMRNWMDGADMERTGIVAASKTLDEKIAELTHGKYKTWEEAARKINDASHNMFTITMLNGVDGKDMPVTEEIPLNAGNALYIYAVNKMNDGRMKLNGMNITEEDVQALADKVREQFGQEILDVVDWVQSDYFSQLRNRYNPTHESLFGAPMDAVENYFPLRINANARQQNEDLSEPDTDAARLLAGTSTGAIKRRTRNSLPLDVRNADFFQEVIRHISQMERWNAFAQWNRDANILFSDINFRNRIKGMKGTIYGEGDKLYNYMKDAFRVAIGTYKPKTDTFSEITLNMAKGVTSAKINFRIFTALKQIASFPAFFTYMQDGVFVGSYLRNWLKPHETMKWAKENLPNFEKRVSKRDMGDMRLMQRSTDWQWNKRILEWSSKYGMFFNVFFDTLTCATGARAVYDSHLADYLKKGYSEEDARNRARQDAEQAFNTSQQSSEGAFMSAVQQDRNLVTAALTVFRTSPIQYTRNFFYHTRNLLRKFGEGKRDEQIAFRMGQYKNDGLNDEQARKAAEKDYNKSLRQDIVGFVVYGALLNILWRLAGQIPYLLLGDDDDKKKQILDDATSGGAWFSPFTGLLGGGIVESALDGNGSVADMFAPEMPFTQDIKRAGQYLSNDKYAEFASQALSVLMQSGTGFDPLTASDMVSRIVTTLDSEEELDAATQALRVSQALLSIPQSQYEQMLIDKVVSGETDEDAALEDYIRYQKIHTAPLTWWLRGEESDEKAEENAEERFDKLLTERDKLHNPEDYEE